MIEVISLDLVLESFNQYLCQENRHGEDSGTCFVHVRGTTVVIRKLIN